MFGLRKRSPQQTPGLEAPAVWRDILGSLRPTSSYNERLEAILAALDKVVGLDLYYLYFLDAEGRRFNLEHIKVKALEEEPETGR